MKNPFSFLLTNGSITASKVRIHCEPDGWAIRYKGMRDNTPLSEIRPESGEPHGRSTR